MPTDSMELLPRYAFLSPLVRGARVLELGALDRTGGVSSSLLHDRGAASVVALGSAAAADRARRDHEGPGLVFRSGAPAQLNASSFDLILLHDEAQLFANGMLATLASLLAPGGHLVVAVRAGGVSLEPGAPAGGYAAALAALRIFPSIEVATQQALVGWVVSPASGPAPALVVDDGFSAGEQPAFHLFVCGATAAGLEDQVLVPLPAEGILARWGEQGAGEVVARERARAKALVGELRGARERIAERESWIEGLRHEVETRDRSGEEQAAALQVARVKLAKLEREHGAATEALRQVREQLLARARELDGARRAIDSRTEDLRLVEAELEQLRTAMRSIQSGRSALLAELEQARAAARSIEERRAALEGELGQARAAAQTHQAELEQLRKTPGSLGAVEREQAQLLQELEALRRLPPGMLPDAPAPDDSGRKLRILEEAADAAARRIREAEERMRAAEKRADDAEAARAESLSTARRWQLEAETARREAAGVAAGMADREALRRERDEALERAAEEAGRRAAARAQLQREIDRALEAEQTVAALRSELERLQAAPGSGPLATSRSGPG